MHAFLVDYKIDIRQIAFVAARLVVAGRRMPNQDGPALIKGDTWRTSSSEAAREIVGFEVGPDGERCVRYRTRYGEFVCREHEFRFWTERRFASVTSIKAGDAK